MVKAARPPRDEQRRHKISNKRALGRGETETVLFFITENHLYKNVVIEKSQI